MFIDETEIFIQAGKGGSGAVSFLREKYRPWGGPAGGDGGDGGSVVFKAGREVDTLLHLHRRRKMKAQTGEAGKGKNCSGKKGDDLIIPVPLGTLIFNKDTNELIADLTKENQTAVAAKGGKGGRGNQHFATATRQTPRISEPGTPGEEKNLKLELKLIADVGFIGLPNAGKSTLLRKISSARPKVADYPFTTKEPHLGVVAVGELRHMVIADLPGLIEGAHKGAGLGDKFLRHVERTAFLLHVVDSVPSDGSDPLDNYKLIENEVSQYSETLASRPRLIAVNKSDLPESREAAERMKNELGQPVILISGLTGDGISELIQALSKKVLKDRSLPKNTW